MIRSALVIVLALSAFGCSDSKPENSRSRLERPNTLPRPPSDGRLPDDLRPPR